MIGSQSNDYCCKLVLMSLVLMCVLVEILRLWFSMEILRVNFSNHDLLVKFPLEVDLKFEKKSLNTNNSLPAKCTSVGKGSILIT